jgi:ketosteroid isomerase-like protein
MDCRYSVVATAMLLMFATGCTHKPAQVDTHDADIRALEEDQAQWLKDFNSRSLNRIVSHFADDSIVIDRRVPPAKGRDEVKKLYKDIVADPAYSLQFAPFANRSGQVR